MVTGARAGGDLPACAFVAELDRALAVVLHQEIIESEAVLAGFCPPVQRVQAFAHAPQTRRDVMNVRQSALSATICVLMFDESIRGGWRVRSCRQGLASLGTRDGRDCVDYSVFLFTVAAFITKATKPNRENTKFLQEKAS